MTYLDMLRLGWMRAGLSGTIDDVNAAGMPSVLAMIISQVWVGLQEDETYNWSFRKVNKVGTVIPGTNQYSLTDLFGAGADSEVERVEHVYFLGGSRLSSSSPMYSNHSPGSIATLVGSWRGLMTR